MAYCPRCGVNVADADRCPLCRTPIILADNEIEPVLRSYPGEHRSQQRNSSKNVDHSLALWILGLIFALPALICLTIDWLISKSVFWSLFVLVPCFYAWSSIGIIISFRKHPAAMGMVLSLTTMMLLFMLDIFDGRIDWFTNIGLPITLLFAFLFGMLVIAITGFKIRGANTAAAILFAIVLFCIGLDVILLRFVHSTAWASWSLIVASALFPVCIFLVYLGSKISREEWDRRFHF